MLLHSGVSLNTYNSAAAINIANNTTGTLFFRVRMGANDINTNFGLTDVDAPSDFADFRAQGRAMGNKLDTRDGGGFANLTTTGDGTGDEADQLNAWYNVWMVVNNQNNTVQYHVQSDDDSNFSTQTQLFKPGGGDIAFRSGTTAILDRLFLKNNTSGTPGTVYFDDFWIDTTGVNLAVVPEPSTLVLLGIALGSVFLFRRRKS